MKFILNIKPVTGLYNAEVSADVSKMTSAEVKASKKLLAAHKFAIASNAPVQYTEGETELQFKRRQRKYRTSIKQSGVHTVNQPMIAQLRANDEGTFIRDLQAHGGLKVNYAAVLSDLMALAQNEGTASVKEMFSVDSNVALTTAIVEFGATSFVSVLIEREQFGQMTRTALINTLAWTIEIRRRVVTAKSLVSAKKYDAMLETLDVTRSDNQGKVIQAATDGEASHGYEARKATNTQIAALLVEVLVSAKHRVGVSEVTETYSDAQRSDSNKKGSTVNNVFINPELLAEELEALRKPERFLGGITLETLPAMQGDFVIGNKGDVIGTELSAFSGDTVNMRNPELAVKAINNLNATGYSINNHAYDIHAEFVSLFGSKRAINISNEQLSIRELVGNEVFYIAHFADKRTRLYSGGKMSHTVNKVARQLTALAYYDIDATGLEHALGFIGRLSNDDAGRSMEKWHMSDIMAVMANRSEQLAEHANDLSAVKRDCDAYDDVYSYTVAVMQYAEALATGRSNMGIPSDGTASALQMFSGLSFDRDTAVQCNLSSERDAQDIYISVADTVADMLPAYVAGNTDWSTVGVAKYSEMLEDYDDGDLDMTAKRLVSTSGKLEFHNDNLKLVAEVARLVDGNEIDRGICKNPTMIVAYSGNLTTTRKSIIKIMIARGYLDAKRYDDERDEYEAGEVDFNYRVVNKVAQLVQGAVDSVVGKPMEVMEFIKDIARAAGQVSMTADGKVYGDNPKPMTLGIKDGYQFLNDKYKTARINVRLHSDTYNSEIVNSHVLDVDGMVKASSPNFIHFLDSHHLKLVVNECAARNVSLTVVHDSFMSNANEYGVLNEVLRQQYVSMFQDNTMLADLLELNKDKLTSAQYDELANRLPSLTGDWDVTECLNNDSAWM